MLGLLTNGAARAALARGELDPIFDTIDTEQLERAAVLLRRDVLKRRRRGAPALVDQYAETLVGQDVDAIAEAFVRSRHFADYRELPHGEPGLCVEEAFFRFLGDAGVGERSVRVREYLRAAAQALVVQPNPAFAIPRPFRRAGGGWVAIDEGPTLYAAVGGRFVQGPVPPVVALALTTDGRHPDARAALPRLEALGFDFPRK
jgi:hypothetical protein